MAQRCFFSCQSKHRKCGTSSKSEWVSTKKGDKKDGDEGAFYKGATLALSGLTVAVLIFQSIIFRDQKVLTDIQFAVTHHPRLKVRNVVIKGPLFQAGQQVLGQFYVSNYGDTDAKIVESHWQLEWNLNGLPMERPYEGNNGNSPILPGTILKAHTSLPALFHTFDRYPNIKPPGSGDSHAFFMGWVEYLDANKLRHRMAFCREYIQRDGTDRFYPVEDPDYYSEE